MTKLTTPNKLNAPDSIMIVITAVKELFVLKSHCHMNKACCCRCTSNNEASVRTGEGFHGVGFRGVDQGVVDVSHGRGESEGRDIVRELTSDSDQR